MRRVRINRGDPNRGAGPFASLVKGDATAVTPNGTAHGNVEPERGDATGAYSALSMEVPNTRWPGGNRSGE